MAEVNPFDQFVTPDEEQPAVTPETTIVQPETDVNPFDQFQVPTWEPGEAPVVSQPGAPEDRTFMGVQLRDMPGPLRDFMGQVDDFGRGFNEMMASTLGVAVDDVDLILRQMGQEGFLRLPVTGAERVKELLKEQGIRADPKNVDSFATNLGRNTFQNMLFLGIMSAMAPTMASIPAKGTTSAIVQNMGKSLAESPASSLLASEAGATIGQTAGQQSGIPGADVVGAVFGAGAGSPAVINNLVRGAGVFAGATPGMAVMDPSTIGIGAAVGLRGANWINKQRAKMFIRKADKPLLEARDYEDAREYARQATEGEKAKILSGIQNTIRNVSQDKTQTPVEAARQWRETAQEALTKARAQETKIWEKVDVTLPMTSQLPKLKSFIAKTLGDISRLNPSAMLPDIMVPIMPGTKLLSPKGKITTIRKMQKMPLVDYINKLPAANLKDFRALSSELGGWLARDIPQKQKLTIGIIKDFVDNTITATYPLKKELAAAAEYSKWINDTFMRGPLAPLVNKAGALKGRQSQGVGKRAFRAVQDERAGEMIAGIQGRLRDPATEMRFQADAQDFITSVFQREASQIDTLEGAGKGVKFLNRQDVKDFMKSFPQYDMTMRRAGEDLAGAVDNMKSINASAFKRLADSDAQTYVDALLSDPAKEAHAVNLMQWLSADKNALDGFQQTLVKRLLERSGDSPSAFNRILQTRDIGSVVNTVLGGTKMQRLNRIVKAGMDIENSTSTKVNSVFLYAFRAKGAQAAKSLGYSTIQASGYGADIGARLGRWVTGEMPVGDLFALAMVDPKYERLLFSRSPTTLKEMKAAQDQLSRVVASITASNAALEGRDE